MATCIVFHTLGAVSRFEDNIEVSDAVILY